MFVAAWALPAAMWDYQMTALVEEASAASPTIAAGTAARASRAAATTTTRWPTTSPRCSTRATCATSTLVGMSMAGGEITRYLTRHGADRVARVVYVATAATPYRTRTADNPDGIPPDLLDAFVRHQLQRDYPQWIEDNRAPFFLPDTPRPIQEWVRGADARPLAQALVDCTRSMATTDFRAELPRIRGAGAGHPRHPRRLGAARRSPAGPPRRSIPGARLEVYEGAPHGLFVTHQERLTADLLAFARS